MSRRQAYELIGLTDPAAMSLGFLVALFKDRKSNTPLVQRIVGGVIDGFEQYEVPDASLVAHAVNEPAISLSVGDTALHAFSFSKGDVALIRNKDEKEALAARIDDPALLGRPLLAMELASFVGRNDLRIALGRQIYDKLLMISRKSADQWRDLSVLTGDLRQRLTARVELRAELLSERIVASVDANVVVLRGVGSVVGSKTRDIVREETLEAVAQLGRLYPAHERWEVEVRESSGSKARRNHEAAVLLASSSARRLSGRQAWPAVPDVEVFADDGSEFTRRVEDTKVPLFIVYDAKEPDVMRRAMGDWTVREMHGIALGNPSNRPTAQNTFGEPWASTFIPRPGIRSVNGTDRNAIHGIQLAIAAELDRNEAGVDAAGRKVVLLRATGTGSDPEGDAWAALYGRAWDMGLDPARVLRLPRLAVRSAGRHDYNRSRVEEALFARSPFIVGDRVASIMEETRTMAAILVDCTPRDDDRTGLLQAVTRLSEEQGWAIKDADYRNPARGLTLNGRLVIPVTFEIEAKSAEKYKSSVLDIDLRALKGIALVGGAGTSAILSGIQSHRLLVVSIRDLVTFPAKSSTLLSLIGNQLMRQVIGLNSASRSQYLAMVAAQGFIGGNVRLDRASQIQSAINDPNLGERLHLVMSKVSRIEEGVFAQIRIIDDSIATPSRSASGFREINKFGIFVQPHQVDIVEV